MFNTLEVPTGGPSDPQSALCVLISVNKAAAVLLFSVIEGHFKLTKEPIVTWLEDRSFPFFLDITSENVIIFSQNYLLKTLFCLFPFLMHITSQDSYYYYYYHSLKNKLK